MTERSADQMTLRETFTGSERLTRELIEHLEQGFLPKVVELQKLVRPHSDVQIDPALQDAALRNSAIRLISSEEFSNQLFERLQSYCVRIDQSVAKMVGDE